MTVREQLYVAAAFLLGALIGGSYVYIYEPGHTHEANPLESKVGEERL